MVGMFLSGEFDHTLDPKGRVTLPARYREYFRDGVVLVRFPDREPCISVFHPDSWAEFDQKYLERSGLLRERGHVGRPRDIYKNQDFVEPDAQGRVLLPAQRIKELGLNGKVKIIGVRTHLEIWDPDTLAAEEAEETRGRQWLAPRLPSQRRWLWLTYLCWPKNCWTCWTCGRTAGWWTAPSAPAATLRWWPRSWVPRACWWPATRIPRRSTTTATSSASCPSVRASSRATSPTRWPSWLDEGFKATHIYLDLGLSSMQIDTPERGFSYSYDAPLDMRMDPSLPVTAADIVNTWAERDLTRLFGKYGEERFSGRIAHAIALRRANTPYKRTCELVDTIKQAIPTPARFGAGNPARRVFQALRIEVNDELGSLQRALPVAFDLLEPGGIMAVISFHSLEDRIVKEFFAGKARGCTCPPDFPVCACGGKATGEVMTSKPRSPGRARVGAQSSVGFGQTQSTKEAVMPSTARATWLDAWEGASTPSPYSYRSAPPRQRDDRYARQSAYSRPASYAAPRPAHYSAPRLRTRSEARFEASPTRVPRVAR